MRKVDTYGYTMKGLKKAASETKELKGPAAGRWVQIGYDTEEKQVLAIWHNDICHYTEWRSDCVINVCGTFHHVTMQHIAYMVMVALKEREA